MNGENGNVTGKSSGIEITGAPSYNPVTNVHYQLFKGYKGNEWTISHGIVSAASFDVTKMTEIDDTANVQPGKTWEINKELSSNGYLRIFPSGSDLDALLSHAFGKTQGWSATKKVTRLDFAKAIIGMQGRSAKPHTEDFSGHISHFGDVGGDIQSIVTEVSHQHDYIMDTDGNEYWI